MSTFEKVFILSESTHDTYVELVKANPSKVLVIGGGGHIGLALQMVKYCVKNKIAIEIEMAQSAGLVYCFGVTTIKPEPHTILGMHNRFHDSWEELVKDDTQNWDVILKAFTETEITYHVPLIKSMIEAGVLLPSFLSHYKKFCAWEYKRIDAAKDLNPSVRALSLNLYHYIKIDDLLGVKSENFSLPDPNLNSSYFL